MVIFTSILFSIKYSGYLKLKWSVVKNDINTNFFIGKKYQKIPCQAQTQIYLFVASITISHIYQFELLKIVDAFV